MKSLRLERLSHLNERKEGMIKNLFSNEMRYTDMRVVDLIE